MRAGMDELKRSGAERLKPLVVGLYAEANSLAGRHADALRAIEEQAFDSLARTQDLAWKADSLQGTRGRPETRWELKHE